MPSSEVLATFQVLVLTAILLAAFFAFLINPGFYLVPSLSALRHCFTFREVPIAVQCFLHLVHFAVHVKACLSRRPGDMYRATQLHFLERISSNAFVVMTTIVIFFIQFDKLQGAHMPWATRGSMIPTVVGRCLYGTGICKNLWRQPDYLSFFSSATNHSRLTSLERSCCGPLQWCHRMATAPLCEAWDVPMKDDSSASGCNNCEPCYMSYAVELQKVWSVSAIYSRALVCMVDRMAMRGSHQNIMGSELILWAFYS